MNNSGEKPKNKPFRAMMMLQNFFKYYSQRIAYQRPQFWQRQTEMHATKAKPTNRYDVSWFLDGIGSVLYALVIGVLVSLIAGYYEIGMKFFAQFWHEDNPLLIDVPKWLFYGIGPFLAVPLLYGIILLIPEKRQHNPADLITGIHVRNGYIDARSGLLSALAAALSLGFGFSVGYYAPIVLLGAAVGYGVHLLIRLNPLYLYISIGAGSAAAIAAIFHAPMGAVLFVHEVLLRFLSVRAFAPITIAAVTAYILSSKLFDKVLFFDVAWHYQPETSTYLWAALTATLAAIIGTYMLKLALMIQKYTHQKSFNLWQQLFCGAFFTAIIITSVPQVAGSSLQSMNGVLGNSYSLSFLLVIFAAKIIATMVAVGFGIPGGIFGSMIFIGAALGALITALIQFYMPQWIDNEQILMITTMAAMVTAVMGSPIAMIVIVMEITGDFGIISVVMLSVVVANITAYRVLGSTSFYDIQLITRGFNIEGGRDRLYSEHQGIRDVISDDYVKADINMRLEEARDLMLSHNKTAAYIEEGGILRGKIFLTELDACLKTEPESSLSSLVHEEPTVILQNASLWQAMEQMTQSGNYCLPVVDGQSNYKMLGVIYNSDLMSRYFTYLRNLRCQENVEKGSG